MPMSLHDHANMMNSDLSHDNLDITRLRREPGTGYYYEEMIWLI